MSDRDVYQQIRDKLLSKTGVLLRWSGDAVTSDSFYESFEVSFIQSYFSYFKYLMSKRCISSISHSEITTFVFTEEENNFEIS